MASLELASKEKLREIAARQDAKEQEIKEKRRQQHTESSPQDQAARLIQVPEESAMTNVQGSDDDQKNYRGYRERRELQGHTLSSSQRWLDALKEAQYRNSTRPRPSTGNALETTTSNNSPRASWKRAGAVARRARNDDTSDDTEGEQGMNAEELEKYRQKKREKKAEREQIARTMGLEYFLEMVDQKHRYGSSLRKYHKVWQESGSKENFFYWLDYGEGKEVELEERPRDRLEWEQVRYMSREERMKYLVRINEDGLLCWVKNGRPITTSPDFKDSIDGIVPVESKTPTWREVTQGIKDEPEATEGDETDSDSVSGVSVGSDEDASKYTNQELHDAKGLKKLKHVSADAIMNNMLRKSTKKNTWIFVADTSFRLYIGIKQSGAFQHSSFLRGGRVSAAGLIRIKRGQLRALDPLSGHYAPPTKNFREFVHSLEETGADMSRVSISRSYAILVGLETYVGAKKKAGKGGQKVKDIAKPEEARKREEESKDKSKSAQREREILEMQAREQEKEKKQQSLSYKIARKLRPEGQE
ncbi:hypothetical protein MBLNU457_7730t1 [Dothideomycetes sp. NU457]